MIKSEIDCPYSREELKLALLGMDMTKLESGEIADNINKAFIECEFLTSKGSSKESISKYHGITIKDLINSPNYSTLVDEYVGSQIRQVISIFKEQGGFSNKEAWGLIIELAEN